MSIKRKSLLLILCVSLIAAGFGLFFRIQAVNAEALNVPSEMYALGDKVELDGSFITASKEKTGGYSIEVDSVKRVSFDEYLAEHGKPLPEKSFSQASVIELEITIRNGGNEDGYLDVNGWKLIPARGNEYYVIDNDLWQMVEPKAPGDTAVMGLLPNSEYKVSIPFASNTVGDERYSVPISDDDFALLLTNAPVEKKVSMSL